jgi:RecA-family ATPase
MSDNYAGTFEEIYGETESERQEREQGNGADKPMSLPLPYVDLTAELKPREWLVPNRIPSRNVSLMSGEGGLGKSLLLMQLAGAVVFRLPWIGTVPAQQGPVLFMSCEEEADEVNRRMEDVARDLGRTRKDMEDAKLRVLSFAGLDAVLANPHPDRFYSMESSPLYWQLREEMIALRPKLFVIDTVADVFAGNEIARSQTRQFITMLRALAINNDCAVVIAAHPSLEGIKSDSGLSGSTGWHNSVRARMYFKATPGEDTSLRVLEFRKNNYGPISESILLRWREGVYVVEPGSFDPDSAEQVLKRLEVENKIDQLFLTLLRRRASQGRNVSDKAGSTYAPTEFAKEPEAKRAKITNKALADAMARLFAAGKLAVVIKGSPSRERSRIVEVEKKPSYSAEPSTPPSNVDFQNKAVGRWKPTNAVTTGTSGPSNAPSDATSDSQKKGVGSKQPTNAATTGTSTPSNDPSNDLPTTFQGGARTPPLIPPSPLEEGKGALEGPPPSNGDVAPGVGGVKLSDPVAAVLGEWSKTFGFGSPVTIPFLVETVELDPDQWWPATALREFKSALLAVAEGEPGKIDSGRLEQWLRENSGVEVGQYTLRDAGTSEDGLARWTLTLRVEPDQGSPSL